MYEIGYTTGTFDNFHHGHKHLLKAMKVWCKTLIVGLVTDELGARQKRQPAQTFEHRRSVLYESGLVDAVVAHRGDTKQIAYEKMKFDVLLIGDDYFGNPEYDNMAVPVIFIPRTPNISSSLLITQQCPIVYPHIIANSLSGPIIQLDPHTVTKSIRIGSSEQDSTSDVYNLGHPRPRNWKRINCEHIHPNITGVNSNREIQIQKIIMGKKWNPVKMVRLAWVSDKETTIGNINDERNNPTKIFILTMIPAGQSMYNWWKTATKIKRVEILDDLLLIISEMITLGIVHNDLHPHNICIDSDDNISIIDFGWVLHHSFEMTTEEKTIYQRKLKASTDWTHFMDSCEFLNMH